MLLIQSVDGNAETAICALTMAGLAFLAMRNEDLIEAGITPENMRGAFIGKNQFIDASEANPAIKRIGFDKSNNFTILREDFKDYIIDISLAQTIDNQLTEETTPQIEIVDIQVEGTHFNNKKKGWDTNDNISFKILDEDFWKQWEKKDNIPRLFDMKVQWSYINNNGKKTHVEVQIVLELDGKTISSILTESECNDIINNPYKTKLHSKDDKKPNKDQKLFQDAKKVHSDLFN